MANDEREQMSEPTGAEWASPAAQPRPAAPVSLDKGGTAGPVDPAQPPPSGEWGQPGQWQGQPGWGGPGQDGVRGWGAPEAPRPGVVPLRPLGLGELLDGAVGLVRGYPRPALGVSAFVALATTLVQLLLLLTVLRPLFDVDTLALEAGDTDALVGLLAGAGGAAVVALVFSTLTGALMTGFMTAIAGRAVLGQPLTLAELWAGTRGKLPRLLAGSLLFGVAVYGPPLLAGGLTALLVVLLGGVGAAVGTLLVLLSVGVSLLLYVRLSLASSALVLEDAPVRTSFRRSWVLVRKSFWRVLGVLLLTVVVGGFVSQVLQLPFVLLSGDDGPLSGLTGSGQSLSTRALVLSAVGAGVATAVVAPFSAGVTALLYVDRRMRAEGLDVALQAAAAARP